MCLCSKLFHPSCSLPWKRWGLQSWKERRRISGTKKWYIRTSRTMLIVPKMGRLIHIISLKTRYTVHLLIFLYTVHLQFLANTIAPGAPWTSDWMPNLGGETRFMGKPWFLGENWCVFGVFWLEGLGDGWFFGMFLKEDFDWERREKNSRLMALTIIKSWKKPPSGLLQELLQDPPPEG